MLVINEIVDKVGYITLNRPEKRNALSPALIEDLRQALVEMAQREEVRVVVIRSLGKAFCAGADLEYIQTLQHFSFEENLQDSEKLKSLFLVMHEFPKPIIAQVQGPALAGGCGLTSLCDIVFSVPDATFGYTEVRIGFIPALVMVFLIRKIGESRARELLLGGALINAYEAKEYGLVHRITGAESLAEEVTTYAVAMAENNSAEAMKRTRDMIRTVADLSLDQALDYAAKQNAEARGTVDCKKGIAAFLGKHKPEW